MGRPSKNYERELRLIRSMQRGTAWTFNVSHPKGFMAKVYEELNTLPLMARKPSFSVRLDKYNFNVIVVREPIVKVPQLKDYENVQN